MYQNLISISDLNNVKINHCYVITKENYHLIKHLKGNRGGRDDNRVNFYVNAIKNGTFDFDLSLIQVGVNGETYEGNHRVDALMIMEMDYVIRIVPTKSIVEVSNFNSGLNPKWKPREALGSAVTANSKVAKFVSKLRAEITQEYFLEERKISASELYGMFVKNAKHFSSGKKSPTVGMWLNEIILTKSKKIKYAEDLRMLAKIKYELKNVRDSYKITKSVMEFYFNGEIDLNLFIKGLIFDGFILDRYTTSAIKERIMSIHQKQVRLSKVA